MTSADVGWGHVETKSPRLVRAIKIAFISDEKLWKGDQWQANEYCETLYAHKLLPEFGAGLARTIYSCWTFRIFYHQQFLVRWLIYGLVSVTAALLGVGGLEAAAPVQAAMLAQIATHKGMFFMLLMSSAYLGRKSLRGIRLLKSRFIDDDRCRRNFAVGVRNGKGPDSTQNP
jgi:uncharacterized membrane protein YtjA (UPF0391 family)